MIAVLLIFIALLVSADQIIKIWAIENLKNAQSMPFLKIGDTEILNLTYLENSGAVFGSFSGMKFMLIGVTAVMIIICSFMMIKNVKKSKFFTWSLALIISGGIGNMIDRIFRDGRVVDYFDVQLFDFAVFNFADCCVVIGVILLMIYVLFLEGRKEKAMVGK